jgi:hypothetical protein
VAEQPVSHRHGCPGALGDALRRSVSFCLNPVSPVFSTPALTSRPQIRGGIPVAFPQFARQGALPLHGFAREKKWRVDKVCSVSRWGQPASVILTLDSDSSTRALWDHAFKLELTVMTRGVGLMRTVFANFAQLPDGTLQNRCPPLTSLLRRSRFSPNSSTSLFAYTTRAPQASSLAHPPPLKRAVQIFGLLILSFSFHTRAPPSAAALTRRTHCNAAPPSVRVHCLPAHLPALLRHRRRARARLEKRGVQGQGCWWMAGE